MKYNEYTSFIDYLISEDSKSNPYTQTKVYLTQTSDYKLFKPAKGSYSIDYSEVSANFINNRLGPEGDFYIKGISTSAEQMNNYILDNAKTISQADEMMPTEMTYEELFNIPAVNKYKDSPLLNTFVEKTRLEEEIVNEKEPDELSDSQMLQNSFGFANSFSQDEYDRYGIPTTPLNGDVASLTADNVVVSAKEKFLARGALLTVQKNTTLYPIGFVNFEDESYYNKYVFNWTPRGIIALY